MTTVDIKGAEVSFSNSARQLGVSPTCDSERERESPELKKYVLAEVSSPPH